MQLSRVQQNSKVCILACSLLTIAVIQMSVDSGDLLMKFHSDITFVQVAVEIIRTVLEYLKVADPTNVLLVSRELIKNAVVHGNQNDRSKEVVYRISRLAQDRFELEVQDSGSGISLNRSESTTKQWPNRLDSDETHGRDFTIISSLSDQVSFNEQGNKITVVLTA